MKVVWEHVKLLRIMVSNLQNMQKTVFFLPVIFVPMPGHADDPGEERRKRDGAKIKIGLTQIFSREDHLGSRQMRH